LPIGSSVVIVTVRVVGRLDVDERIRVGRQEREVVGVAPQLEAVPDVTRGERLAVVERGPVDQLEGPGALVVGDGPRGRERRL
jgi:hypothetical protein